MKKIIAIVITVISILVIILSAVQLLGVWDKAINIAEPLIGVVLLLQAIQLWDNNKKAAIFSLCASVFIFAVAIIILLF